MEYEWIGRVQPFLDEVSVTAGGNVHIGHFGGSSINGAQKNEDALFILQNEENSWTFCALLDAHNSSQSAELIIRLLNDNKDDLISIFNSNNAFLELEPYFLNKVMDAEFKDKCRNLTGETSCLFCFQRGAYLWWFSIGDCMALLFHPDLAKFNQYGLNQRQFYEWVGQVNTFDLSVPCYTAGRRQLRQGTNYIVLLTDGVLDTDDEFYSDYRNLYNAIVQGEDAEAGLRSIFDHLVKESARDSATLVCWKYLNKEQAQSPSDSDKLNDPA
ncbi:protein phosphatase 2C domain-containing protein [Paenibacillus pinistramenti]|uniref:protein phosphatase 2C domain-containing protein n=1 Tax=Paenibacillus pinistramenti TaxID=1768003 RepID=UPI001108B57A|nr:protein phosphatase 2C domain-containing protein [Paenibacillus pinistramenti]